MKVKPPTRVVPAENDSAVVLDTPKKAVPVGTVAGVQLAAVLKSPEPGLSSQVASCARAGHAAATSAVLASIAAAMRCRRTR